MEDADFSALYLPPSTSQSSLQLWPQAELFFPLHWRWAYALLGQACFPTPYSGKGRQASHAPPHRYYLLSLPCLNETMLSSFPANERTTHTMLKHGMGLPACPSGWDHSITGQAFMLSGKRRPGTAQPPAYNPHANFPACLLAFSGAFSFLIPKAGVVSWTGTWSMASRQHSFFQSRGEHYHHPALTKTK